MSLADVLRTERTDRAWSQQHLADASGVSLRTVQRAERGDPVAGKTLLALAAALDVDVQALVVARQQAVALAPTVPAVVDPYRRLAFNADRAAWVGLLMGLPVLWFIAGTLLYMATGSQAGLPPGVEAHEKTLRTSFDGGFYVGLTIAALLANAFAVVVRRDTRVNVVVAGVLVTVLAFLVVLA